MQQSTFKNILKTQYKSLSSSPLLAPFLPLFVLVATATAAAESSLTAPASSTAAPSSRSGGLSLASIGLQVLGEGKGCWVLAGGSEGIRGILFSQELLCPPRGVAVYAVEVVQLAAPKVCLCNHSPHARRDAVQGPLAVLVGFPSCMTQLLCCCIKQHRVMVSLQRVLTCKLTKGLLRFRRIQHKP